MLAHCRKAVPVSDALTEPAPLLRVPSLTARRPAEATCRRQGSWSCRYPYTFAFDDNRHRAVHYSAKLPPLK